MVHWINAGPFCTFYFKTFLIGKHSVVGFYVEYLRVPPEGQTKNLCKAFWVNSSPEGHSDVDVIRHSSKNLSTKHHLSILRWQQGKCQ